MSSRWPCAESSAAGRLAVFQQADQLERSEGPPLRLRFLRPRLRRPEERPERAGTPAPEACADQGVLEHRQLGEGRGRLLRADDTAAGSLALGRRLEPVASEGDRAGIRPELARQRPQRGCLARSVRPDQRVHRTRRDVEVEIVERDEALEALGEPACGERLGVGHARERLDVAAGRTSGEDSRCLPHQPRTAGSRPDTAQSEDEQQAVARQHLLEPPRR